jgi:hypothetical protein
LAYIAVTIFKANEAGGGCGLVGGSHRGSKSGSVECGAVKWEETMWLRRRFLEKKMKANLFMVEVVGGI